MMSDICLLYVISERPQFSEHIPNAKQRMSLMYQDVIPQNGNLCNKKLFPSPAILSAMPHCDHS